MENNNEQANSEKSSLKEKAINLKETDGKEINKQKQQRRQKHQPRDNA